ncbi:NAD-dependent epimerase/dehydratase family protein [Tautonia sociabilis]|uniref:NAD(P)-dependent oxidoreductase n=1 Tax=Tautonia sociabilis TaxID=2080755 RepID=A0A432MET2_9BACT|nr:NAD(P)-dependent oxidoreductase [Tautonia sociabilis]RUL84193.1 NAD(P)-dependent oxidoreductase [Tautonia sociabilis]
MKILFTGGSSFTGLWFLRELSAAGHEVTAVFRRRPDDYDDEPRRSRVRLASEVCLPVFRCSFGDDTFLSLLDEGGFDLLCHHGADVTNYKSPDFDAVAALRNNTANLPRVLSAFKAAGGRSVLLTGSIAERGEGAGSQGLPEFSPYGLSKALTFHTVRHYCESAGLGLGKFVIPNPFGPFEDPRFTAYLMRHWLAGTRPSCATPLYIRDNIHVSLLAKAYARFASELPSTGLSRLNPSGYIESQGAFALRMARAMEARLGLPCPVDLSPQVDFPEPRIRINTDPLDPASLGWDEQSAWDAIAEYYTARSG